jgi:hypothetical protein
MQACRMCWQRILTGYVDDYGEAAFRRRLVGRRPMDVQAVTGRRPVNYGPRNPRREEIVHRHLRRGR